MRTHHLLTALAVLAGLQACKSADTDTADTDVTDTADTHITDTADTDVPDAPGDYIASGEARNMTPGVPSTTVQALTRDNRDFAFDLYQELATEDGNLFFSPHSISVALAMTYAGAEATTETQMASAMHFDLPEADLHPAFNQLDLDLATRSELSDDEDGDGFELHIVNATWAQVGYPFTTTYLDLLAINYGAGMYQIDFSADPERCRTDINDWVEGHTNNRIEDLLPVGSITGNTTLVLANAIYFKASWEAPFEAVETTDEAFHLHPGGTVTAPTMHGTHETTYADGDGWTLVELPYVGHDLTMVILVPDTSRFDEIESGLDADFFDGALSAAGIYEVELALPKFSFRSEVDLADPLKALGMTDAFDSGLADFSGMSTPSDLFIQGVFHQGFVDVNEEGTEAAAATAVVVGNTSVPEQVVLDVDRPFFVAVRDGPTGALLFLGRIVDPS